MITKQLRITCDTPGCHESIASVFEAGDQDAPGKIRRIANDAGWQRVARRDACPNHVNTTKHLVTSSRKR